VRHFEHPARARGKARRGAQPTTKEDTPEAGAAAERMAALLMEEEEEEEEEVAKAAGTPTQEASGARAKQCSVSRSVRVPTQRVRGVRMRHPGHYCVLTSRARVSLCSESTMRMMQAALREAECKDWRRRQVAP
jgi:hypothetical protein